MQVIIASGNQGKIAEFQNLLSPFRVEIVPMSQLPDAVNVEETGDTFKENARLKAEAISSQYNKPVIADDSGLVVDALDGRPGVISARYAGPEKDDRKNLNKVLNELSDVPKNERSARFYCVIALAVPGKETKFAAGTCEGLISESPKGEHGFGYDPIFYLPEKQMTMAEIDSNQKNQISHRAKAIKVLKEHWKQWTEAHA